MPQHHKCARPANSVQCETRDEWRGWLAENNGRDEGVWLVTFKKASGRPSMGYDASVEEALCFGWIDSLIKRLDDDRYLRKFTPRQPTSKWSDINRMRWMALKEAGLLTAAGLAAAPTDNSYTSRPPIPDLPSYIARALKQNPKAWQFFQSLAPTYRRHFVGWIHSAKRQETRGKRIRESLELLTAGKKLGLK